jgi:hypothetical protein
VENLEFKLKEEKKFLSFLKVRKSEVLPEFPKFVSIGYKEGSMIHGVDFTNNNFNEETRFFNYAFKIKGNKLYESFSMVGMEIHIESPIENVQIEPFAEAVFSFYDIKFWDQIENTITYTELRRKIKELLLSTAFEGIIDSDSTEGLAIRSNERYAFIYTQANGWFYIQSLSKDKEIEEELFKKIKGAKLEKLFK